MTTANERVSYIYPNENAAGAGLMLSEKFTPNNLNLSDGGYNMYTQRLDWLGRPCNKVARHPVPPLKGKYIVVHGIHYDSQANLELV
ncbi:hypothetical protein IFM89_000213 [Coptis chinensis]|uniref:Uncharacterized protein n=1 Tax=Coptis chinensis TaxID=261450 RepID=A0A835I6H0_9MAGN|nr:hypothetical protein IFM89_000213 [Coptis chinensis]